MKSLLLVLLLDVQNVHNMPGECFMFQPLGKGKSYVNDISECNTPTPPAGTFNIPHTLIAMELGLVKDALAPETWPHDQQPFENWRKDHSLSTALNQSVEWYFEKSAQQIGAARFKEQLAKLGYAADTIEFDDVNTLTISGDLVVTPREQMEFLIRMFRYELPAKESSIDVVKNAMQMPPDILIHPVRTIDFKLQWPAGTVVRATTGNSRVGKERFSWVVGALQSGKNEYVFVARLRANRSLFPSAGADVAFKYLNALAPK